MARKLVFVLVLLLVLYPVPVRGQMAAADEPGIKSFLARITILPQGGIEVSETVILTVHQDSPAFERLLPRWHETEHGLRQACAYEILEVLRDGRAEAYTLTDCPDGLTVTMGSTLPPGRYVFTLRYRSMRLFRFHESLETLVWTAAGPWPWPAERVAVSVDFARTPRPGFSRWGALVGGRDRDWTSTLEEEDWLKVEAVRPLEPGETMVVEVSWPRGYADLPRERERILSLDARAVLDESRRLTVREEIVLDNDGSFQSGFVRDFPGLYRDAGGRRRLAELEVVQVQVNGADVPWTWQSIHGGRRLVVGSPRQPLPRGRCSLVLVYSLDRQAAVAGGREEIKWLLPGYFLDREIDQVTFSLELPEAVQDKELLAASFIGGAGTTDSQVFHYTEGEKIVFATTRPLAPGENLVCAVAWPRGALPPAAWQYRLRWWLRDNAGAAVSLGLLALLLGWYGLLWLHRGRRPAGKVQPVSALPAQASPALLRYVRTGVYDSRSFTASVISLAVQGRLLIVEEAGKYALVRGGAGQPLPRDEETLLQALFARNQAVFLHRDRTLLRTARQRQKRELLALARGKLLHFNRGRIYPAAFLAAAGAVLSSRLLPVSVGVTLAFLGFMLWGFALAMLALSTAARLPGLADDWGWTAVALVLAAELAAAAGLTWLWGRWLATHLGWTMPAAGLGINAATGFFLRALTVPTPAGQQLLDQARGLRQWLAMDREKPGGPARFEKYLPYAVALDVAGLWGRRFGVPRRKGGLTPRWYQGSPWHTVTAEALAASLTRLSPSPGDESR